MTLIRETVGLWIVLLGKKLVKLGDWIGGWEETNVFRLGYRIGVQEERQAADERAWKQERGGLPREW